MNKNEEEKEIKPFRTTTFELEDEQRKQIINWATSDEVIGKEIEVQIFDRRAGEVGKFICKVKEWQPNDQPK